MHHIFLLFSSFFSFFCTKNVEKSYFDQHFECTTAGQNIQHPGAQIPSIRLGNTGLACLNASLFIVPSQKTSVFQKVKTSNAIPCNDIIAFFKSSTHSKERNFFLIRLDLKWIILMQIQITKTKCFVKILNLYIIVFSVYLLCKEELNLMLKVFYF